MNYIVLDLEFNQPFNFKTGRKTVLNPDCPFEIIQIGAVKLDCNFETISKFDFLIRPKLYKRMHPYVEKITHLSMSELNSKPSFIEAYLAFADFVGNDKSILCTWGNDDIRLLYTNILFYKLDTSLIPNKYINVQSYTTKHLNYEKGNTVGLKNAATLLGLSLDASFHNALNDAEYTGKILKMVHPKKILPKTFVIDDLISFKPKIRTTNTKELLVFFETKLERELTAEEKCMIKTAYAKGKKSTFEN